MKSSQSNLSFINKQTHNIMLWLFLTVGVTTSNISIADGEDKCEAGTPGCEHIIGTPIPKPKEIGIGGALGGDSGNTGGGSFGGGGGSSAAQAKAECLQDAEQTYLLDLASADMSHYRRLKSNCKWLAGFPSGGATSLCIEMSNSLLNSNNHVIEAAKSAADFKCNNP